jgi:hypothetical protein
MRSFGQGIRIDDHHHRIALRVLGPDKEGRCMMVTSVNPALARSARSFSLMRAAACAFRSLGDPAESIAASADPARPQPRTSTHIVRPREVMGFHPSISAYSMESNGCESGRFPATMNFRRGRPHRSGTDGTDDRQLRRQKANTSIIQANGE